MSAFICLENGNDFIKLLHKRIDNGEVTIGSLLDHGVPSWYANIIISKKTFNKMTSDLLETLADALGMSVIEILRLGGLLSERTAEGARSGPVPYLSSDDINSAGGDFQKDLDQIRKEVEPDEED